MGDWVKVIIVAILFFSPLTVGILMDSGDLFGFDGDIAEPGCDWTNKNCEPEDIRANCADFGGSIFNANYVRYCVSDDKH